MKIYQVDAFTQKLYQGNSAAVVVLDEWLSEETMQQIAFENNLSETAFIKQNTAQSYQIRWFTPVQEVDFCGHATLAGAFVLFNFYIKHDTLDFETTHLGVFNIKRLDDGKIQMNFPCRDFKETTDYPLALQQALTQPFKAVYLSEQAYVVEYENKEAILNEKPDLALLKTLGNERDVVITAPSDDQYDCYSRYFAPAIGLDEDPVTGSIHTIVAPLWAKRLNKKQIFAYQASARGGELFCELLENNRIHISGYGCLYMQGTLKS